jgi:signal transduction histidine kinase
LIDNAVKYTGAGGRVDVRLTAGGDLSVRDTGVGISVTDLPHVFDRFWRADRVRSRGMGGAGLGLAIARWTVERHGGSIAVESRLGGGTTFTVRLPVPESKSIFGA